MATRRETDSMGSIEVPASALWGAQTQRSLINFASGAGLPGGQRFPQPFIHAFALVKKAAAQSNHALGLLPVQQAELIGRACDEIMQGQHDDQFPLVMWQTGSGTQTNMNLNEVIANRANELAGNARGSKHPVHPNDHVNLSQSSNDVFPTVMNVVIAAALRESLLPALDTMLQALADKAAAFDGLMKAGRTHMMDATPISLGQEFSGYHRQLSYARSRLEAALPAVQALAIGGSAVGTGMNTPPHWVATVTQTIAALTGIDFSSEDNKFMALAGHDVLTDLHGGLRTLASSVLKIANDLRLMASGPRCGLAEIRLPENEPGSSIMPGKVNPTQIEALSMVAIQVLGNDTAVGFANSQGQFELNVYKPLIFRNVYESIVLLTDALQGFTRHCLLGLEADAVRLAHYAEVSLMRATELTPYIGYDLAARSAQLAHTQQLSLKEAVLQLGAMTEADFERALNPLPPMPTAGDGKQG
ncbi:MAG TPA: class II fumarate hydratase [Pseudomonadaceae bacterium]|nr:class II fumarate hydratase [Pseudomonadaceae bacterium]